MVKGLKLAGIALAIVVGIFGLLAIWQWDTIRFVLDNYHTLGEGSEWAEEISEPEDILRYIDGNPDRVAFYAVWLNDTDRSIGWRAEELQPMASVYKILILAEVARQMEAGKLDPDQMIPVEDIRALYLPGTDGEAHNQAFDHFENEGLIRRDNIALREVIRAMIRWSDNAASDYLILLSGRENLENLVEELDIGGLEVPFPINGSYLMWENHEQQDSAEERLTRYRELDRWELKDKAYMLSRRMQEEETFRKQEQSRLDGGRLGLDLRMQRDMTMTFSPVGSARAYAEIMRKVFLGSFISEEVSAIMQEYLEWPMTHETIQQDFMRFGTKGGSLPGVLTSAYYGRSVDGDPVMVSLLFQDMHFAVWFHLMQQHLHQDFELKLMKEPEFRYRVEERLQALDQPE